jgi:hypothetical protein
MLTAASRVALPAMVTQDARGDPLNLGPVKDVNTFRSPETARGTNTPERVRKGVHRFPGDLALGLLNGGGASVKRILGPTVSGRDWQRLLTQPHLHWVPGKSAMSAAASWESAAPRLPPEITAALEAAHEPDLSGLELIIAIPEWEVPLPGGSATSCTDVLAIASNTKGLVTIAVEAKVDEEFGPTIGEKRHGASAGQLERLEFLHRSLGLASPLPDDARYQLLHRAASAVLVARKFHAPTAVMIVQSFSPESRWLSDYQRFCRVLGVEGPVGAIAPVPGRTGPRLFLGWCSGDQRFRTVDLRSS